ncbi:MAG: RHE_PE00001 family protein [Methylocystis sp.]
MRNLPHPFSNKRQLWPPDRRLLTVNVSPTAAEFLAIDAVIARSSRLLAAGPDAATAIQRSADSDEPGHALIYDPDHDEQAFFAQWRSRVEATATLPPTLAAAVAYEAWQELSPAEHDFWLGPLLVADLLRSRGKARAHLPCVNLGLRAVPWDVRRHKEREARLGAHLAALKNAGDWGLAEHDRLAVARACLQRRCRGKRGNSRLPALADLVVAKPFVTAAMAAAELAVSPRAALDMIAAFDLRELTGRGRFRAWGV